MIPDNELVNDEMIMSFVDNVGETMIKWLVNSMYDDDDDNDKCKQQKNEYDLQHDKMCEKMKVMMRW